MVILNTIVTDNLGDCGIYFNDSDQASISYSDFFDNQNGNFAGTPPQNLGNLVTVNANDDSCDIFYNIYQDPLYVLPLWGDYRLNWESPCIDAGDPDPQYNDPDGTVADMGAFYFDQSIPIRILLTPHNAPIAIPAEGGSFDYGIQLTYLYPPETVEIWTEVTLPSGVTISPVLGPVSMNLWPGMILERVKTQMIPAGAPAGVYSYSAFAVVSGYTSTDGFTFVKLGQDGSDYITGWDVSGETFEDWFASGGSAVETPTAIALYQNYPNPFNPLTTISYAIPRAAHVTLNVYDISGRLVTTLIDGYRDAGYHEVTFDGSGLPSGIYVYRIEAGQFTASSKMVLLK